MEGSGDSEQHKVRTNDDGSESGAQKLVYVQKFFGFLLAVFGFILHTRWYTLSIGGDQSAMEPSWTMVSVMGYGNWDRIVFPAYIHIFFLKVYNMYNVQFVHKRTLFWIEICD